MSEQASMADDAPHLLIVDDDTRIRELLQKFLTGKGFRVTVAADAAEARRKLEGLDFDLLVLDVMMPGETGMALTHALKRVRDVPVILLTARAEAESRIAGLEAGADDYLAKPFDPRELVLRINNILRRAANPARPKIDQLIFGPYTFSLVKKELRKGPQLVGLTGREQDIMMIFAANAGQTIARHELAGTGTDVGERTIDVQINRLRRKIEDDPCNPVWLQTVRGIGYKLSLDQGGMTTPDTDLAPIPLDEPKPRIVLANISRFLRRNLPRGLFARSLLIIVLPMLILQTVLVFVFMERHWQMVSNRLSAAVTRDIASVIDLLDQMPDRQAEIIRIAEDRMGLTVKVEPGNKLPPREPVPFFSIIDRMLSRQINNQINRPFWIDSTAGPKEVEIRVALDGNRILSVITPRDRTFASNSHIFLIWMFGTAIVLLVISILFLHGQIRPILSLARAAESFGKGQKPVEAYHPRGAVEVRHAGLAFLQMRERIERQIEQRTAMLSGVSHDLRTILTRFRLQLAIAEDKADLESLNRDVDDMNAMLDGYLDFARDQSEEAEGLLDLAALLRQLEETAELHGKTLTSSLEGPTSVKVRPNAFSRLVTNLAANAWRHGETVKIEARSSGCFLTVTVDDDGPGIPAEMREDVFKPFFRLDEARNLDASGTGLGLAIARDIARSHGGDVTLSDSQMGGLRAMIRVPI